MEYSEDDEELILDIRSRMLLHWNYRNLNEIPKELLSNGSHIREIYFKRNCLTTLPPQIGALLNLTNLYLSGNMITHLPGEIGDLQALKVLELTQNLLKTLPSEIGRLKTLEELYLTHNQIERLPSELMYLNNLKYLELSGNKLTHISPFVIAGLDSLQHLGLDGNPLKHLPRNVASLKNLNYVSVCKCNLTFLPGVPFNLLISQSGNADPVITTSNRFTILFDSNENLHHIPYWIIQYIGRHVDCFGCASKQDKSKDTLSPDSSQLSVQVVVHGKQFVLNFDPDLTLIRKETEKTPNSLLEICLRNIYDKGLWEKHEIPMLPSCLEMLLLQGPTTTCFWCIKPIFREGWLLTFAPDYRSPQELELDELQNAFDERDMRGTSGIKTNFQFGTSAVYLKKRSWMEYSLEIFSIADLIRQDLYEVQGTSSKDTTNRYR